jgi:hypothetical protein
MGGGDDGWHLFGVLTRSLYIKAQELRSDGESEEKEYVRYSAPGLMTPPRFVFGAWLVAMIVGAGAGASVMVVAWLGAMSHPILNMSRYLDNG